MTLDEQNEMIEQNIPLVHYCIKKYFPAYMFDEDVVSSGKLGLVKACRTFDPSKNIKFSSYGSMCIKNEILIYFRKENKHNGVISLDLVSTNIDKEDPRTLMDFIKVEDKNISNFEIRDLILSLQTLLSEDDFKLFSLRYIHCLKQREIADIYHVSQSLVSRLLSDCRKKIRKLIE